MYLMHYSKNLYCDQLHLARVEITVYNASKHFTGESLWKSIVQNYLFLPSPIKGGGGEALAEKYSVSDICCVKIELSRDKNV